MQTAISKITVPIILLLSALFIYTSQASASGPHKPITQKLIALLEKEPALKTMLETSLSKAKTANPDIATNPAQNLQDYYDFVDEASELIPQVVMQNPKSLIREQILESICYFYYLVDQPLTALEDKGLFNNTIQYDPKFSTWLREFADAWGDFLDTEASWTDKTFEEFKKDSRFGFQHDWYGEKNIWKTFNSFFSRYLISPSVRPIASPYSNGLVVSPADSVPQGVWDIDENSNIAITDGLKVKLTRYFSVEDLVGEHSQYKDVFAGGMLTHSFLNVNDYHRYHFAVSGTVKEVQQLVQNVSLEVTWNTETRKYDPIDSMGWQFSQTRGVVIVDTGTYGLVALIPMGMAHVSSVNFEDDVKVGARHKKGDMLGTFLFGGSDFVMVFQKQAGFTLTASKEKDTTDYEHLLMGQPLGKMRLQY